MKTAISLPDVVFHQVTVRAAELGISRSEFFVHAAQRYLEALDEAALVERINAALPAQDDSARDAVAAGRRVLEATDDEW